MVSPLLDPPSTRWGPPPLPQTSPQLSKDSRSFRRIGLGGVKWGEENCERAPRREGGERGGREGGGGGQGVGLLIPAKLSHMAERAQFKQTQPLPPQCAHRHTEPAGAGTHPRKHTTTATLGAGTGPRLDCVVQKK